MFTSRLEHHMTQYARFRSNAAWLGTEFGESFARRMFGDAAVDSLPRYKSGRSAGKVKADIAWVKCLEGGWVGEGRDAMREEAIGRVERRVGKTLYAQLRTRDAVFAATGDSTYEYLLRSI